MKPGSRIRERRLLLGLSVADVAAALGKNRATVYRYESGYIEDLPTTVLEPLARVLQTTPAYLAGWTDEPAPLAHPDLLPIARRRRIPLLGEIRLRRARSIPRRRRSWWTWTKASPRQSR